MDAATSSSLVYTLDPLNAAKLEFADFYLIIRSLHTFKVSKISPDEAAGTVIVDLGYNASIKNVRAKLGGAAAAISVAKANPNVAPTELGRLAQLKSLFNFGGPIAEDEDETSQPSKKRKYKASSKPNI